MRKIYDISLTISPDIPVWPGNPPVELERVEKIEEGAEANLSRLNTIVHCGTHVDAPYHFLADGKRVDHLSLEAMIGPAWVVQIPPEVERITRPVLEKVLPAERIERLLFRTRDSQQWQQGATSFRKDLVSIAADGAQYLVERGVRLVGVDYLSVASFEEPVPTHQILLGAQVVVLEGVNLAEVPPGAYELVCLPLKLAAAEAAPARVVLIANAVN
ncbi:MAG: cyclase family protein [Chloroflexi bacterium]|nr:cyclase family protein [Chloroflexota bacterium]